MKVRCLVGGCGWEQEGDLSVVLEKAAEKHRTKSHFWVKPGRVHRIEFEENKETPVEIISSGRKAELRRKPAHRWV